VKVIIEDFITLDQDIAGFKEHLRDFLVQIHEATGNESPSPSPSHLQD
jgi:exportin-1